jgi:hypothetical protein
MTEEEFQVEAKKNGIPEDVIRENVEAIRKMKKFIPNLTYEESLKTMIKIQNEPNEELSV